jgi:WD40 repeat protein
MLAWADTRSIHVWDTVGAQKASPLLQVRSAGNLTFSPDGSRLAWGRFVNEKMAGFVEVWDYRNGKEIFSVHGHSDFVRSVAFSPDGRLLASGSADKSVVVWDIAAGKELFTFRGHLAWVGALAFSPDSTRLASGSADGTVRVWDVRPLDVKGYQR